MPFAQLPLDLRVVGVPWLQIAVLADADHRFPTVESGIRAGHRDAFDLMPARIAHRHGGARLGTALDEHLRGDGEWFAEFHACREQPVLGGGRDVHDVDAAELVG